MKNYLIAAAADFSSSPVGFAFECFAGDRVGWIPVAKPNGSLFQEVAAALAEVPTVIFAV